MPEISVVMPVFNGAKTVRRAAQSILDQTFRDLELVVVDDGSTDETSDVIAQIEDPRLRLTRTTHCGVSSAANTATRMASSPMIARMDADDFSHATRLEKQLKMLRQQNLDVVGCQVKILDKTGRPSKTLARYQRWINEETIRESQIAAFRFVEFPLVNPTILARREYFELGFVDNEFPEDYDLMLRASAARMRMGKVPELLFDWADNPQRLTRRDDRYSLDAFMQCRRHYFYHGPLSDLRNVDLWGIGKTGKPWMRWLQSKGITVRRAFDIDDRKVGETIHGVRVEYPSDLKFADGTLLVIAVGADDARKTILPQIEAKGYVSGSSAWFVS